MPATAELVPTITTADELLTGLSFDLPDVLMVPDMLIDQQARQRAAQFIGAIVLEADMVVEAPGVQDPIESLCEAIHRAADGDEKARRMIEINAKTDVIERTIKTGHVMDPVSLIRTADGDFMQHGQTTESVQANSLRYAADHPIMLARTEAETRNMFRTKALFDAGFFEDYNLVVISRAENLPGFFEETMSCCIQVTSEQKGGLQIESAFVSGIAEPGGEEHDEETVIKLGRRLDEGVDFTGKTPAQIIDTPILVRKERMPNGAIDIVQLFDECAGGTFFGENKPQEDYLAYREKCRTREASFMPKVYKITNELISEASTIHTPVRAIQRLHKISEQHMVEHAMKDKSINPLVFGRPAAIHIEAGRIHYALGNMSAFQLSTQSAQKTANSSACPSALKRLSNKDSLDEFSKQALDPLGLNEREETDQDEDSDEYGSLTFVCDNGHLNRRKRGELLDDCQTKGCNAVVSCK